MAYIGSKRVFNITSKGDSAFIRFSEHADGTDFTEHRSDKQKYVGFATGQVAPADKTGFDWLCGEFSESDFYRYLSKYLPESLLKISRGLLYRLTDDGTGYVVDSIGSCKDVNLIIQPYVNNLPVKEIGANAFLNNATIGSVVMPDTIEKIGDFAFDGCTNLNIAVIPDNVTYIGKTAFRYCPITSVKIPDGVKEILGTTFGGCAQLKSVDFGNGVTTIGSYAFSSCLSLTSITLPKNITEINSVAFNNCKNITTINCDFYEGEVSNAPWGAKNATINYKPSLNYTLSDDGTYYTVTGRGTIKDTDIVIPSTYLGLPVKAIGKTAFLSSDITSVVIPEGVTSITQGAFYMCRNLTNITIPNSLEYLDGENIFYVCNSLQSIILPANIISISAWALNNCQIDYIYCRFSKGKIEGAPWGASTSHIVYDYEG